MAMNDTVTGTIDEPGCAAPYGRHALLVGSNGGHLAQLLALRPWWEDHERTWVTFGTPDALSRLHGETVIAAYHPTTRNTKNLLRNTVVAWRTLRRVRPDIIVSTGAAVAVPFFFFALLFRIPTVFVEVFDRVDSRTLTGRLVRPMTTRFLVQWEQQQEMYPGSILVGRLL